MPRMAARGSASSAGVEALGLIGDAGGFIGVTVRLKRGRGVGLAWLPGEAFGNRTRTQACWPAARQDAKPFGKIEPEERCLSRSALLP